MASIETADLCQGRRLSETIQVDKGDRVKRAQVLAVLDSPELDHQVENARADYDSRSPTIATRFGQTGVIAQQDRR